MFLKYCRCTSVWFGTRSSLTKGFDGLVTAIAASVIARVLRLIHWKFYGVVWRLWAVWLGGFYHNRSLPKAVCTTPALMASMHHCGQDNFAATLISIKKLIVWISKFIITFLPFMTSQGCLVNGQTDASRPVYFEQSSSTCFEPPPSARTSFRQSVPSTGRKLGAY